MIRKILARPLGVAGLFAALIAVAATAQVLNSFKPGVLWLDTQGNRINAHGGGIYAENGTYYWFGEKRNRGSSGGVNVYSSTDLYNWKFERLALALDSTLPIRPGCIIERPKVVRNAQTGKYVMWFHLEIAGHGYDSAYAGVAESDSITGPYTFKSGFRPNNNMSRDQNLFVDDDGTAYHFYSSRDNYDMRLHALTPDGLGAMTRDSMLFSQHREAPAVFKHNDKYFLITSGATGWDPNAATVHVASNIWGPWVSKGNPAKGTGANTTYTSQSTFVFPVPGYKDAYIYMGDRWTPNGTDGVEGSFYVWLPLRVSNDSAILSYSADWKITDVFGAPVALNAKGTERSSPEKRNTALRVRGPEIETGIPGEARDLAGRRRPSIPPTQAAPAAGSEQPR